MARNRNSLTVQDIEEHRKLASMITCSPVTPKRKIFKIESSPSPTPSSFDARTRTIMVDIEDSPDCKKRLHYEIESSPLESANFMVHIEDSPDCKREHLFRKDDSHWFRCSTKKSKLRSRKSLNKSEEFNENNKPLSNVLYHTLKSQLKRSADEGLNYINSLGPPSDFIDPLFKKRRQFRPNIEVFVTAVKPVTLFQCFLQVTMFSSEGLNIQETFYSDGERATLLLERKICTGMGIEPGTTLRLTYPLNWSRVHPQKELVISNVFYIEAIKREQPVETDYMTLFTFDCPCQPNTEAHRYVPLCSSSQCDGNLPVSSYTWKLPSS